MMKRGFSGDLDKSLDSKKPCVFLSNGVGKPVKENSYRIQIRKALNILRESAQLTDDINFCCCRRIDKKIYQDYKCVLLKDGSSSQYSDVDVEICILQLLVKSTLHSDHYFIWQRSNSTAGVGLLNGKPLKGPYFDPEYAVNVFESMFMDKTGYSWGNRKNFYHIPGKYHILTEYDCFGYTDVLQFLQSAEYHSVSNSVLDVDLQQLVCLITNGFTFELQKMNIDLKKMPFTDLNRRKIEEGYKALDDIETAIQRKAGTARLDYLTKHFYRIIPHTAIHIQKTFRDVNIVHEKKEMLKVLEDIELIMRVQKTKLQEIPWINFLRCEECQFADKVGPEYPSVIDLKYELLNCKLKYIDSHRKIHQLIHRNVKNTGRLGVIHIWKVKREDEVMPYAAHDALANRKLVWHGTHLASVTNILRSGLCINYRLTGKFGTGLYFAPHNSKAASSVSYNAEGQGIMFLCEVALGKEYHVMKEVHSLTAPPTGFQSVVARGSREPDPTEDVVIKLNGRKVVFPVGPPCMIIGSRQSQFSQSEYIVYQESQVRLRYLVQVTYKHQKLE